MTHEDITTLLLSTESLAYKVLNRSLQWEQVSTPASSAHCCRMRCKQSLCVINMPRTKRCGALLLKHHQTFLQHREG
nr:MAG TPA: hypothetical protein [Caudoviricetes sp.]